MLNIASFQFNTKNHHNDSKFATLIVNTVIKSESWFEEKFGFYMNRF